MQNNSHERIAIGIMSAGIAFIPRELLEIHIQQTPGVRGVKDYIPVAATNGMCFVGWRQKVVTWGPLEGHQVVVTKQYAA